MDVLGLDEIQVLRPTSDVGKVQTSRSGKWTSNMFIQLVWSNSSRISWMNMVSIGCRDTTKVAGWKIRDEDMWHIAYSKMEDLLAISAYQETCFPFNSSTFSWQWRRYLCSSSRDPYTRNILILLMTTRLSVKNASHRITPNILFARLLPHVLVSRLSRVAFPNPQMSPIQLDVLFQVGGDAEVSQMVEKSYLAT